MPLEIHVDDKRVGGLPDEPWARPDGSWNELRLDYSGLVSVRWDVPPGVATLDNCTLGPDARIEPVLLKPGQTVDLHFGEVEPDLIPLLGPNLPIVAHTVRLTRT